MRYIRTMFVNNLHVPSKSNVDRSKERKWLYTKKKKARKTKNKK